MWVFRTPTRLGDVLAQCPGGDNNGFDHNFVLANTEGKLNFVCRVEHTPSGQFSNHRSDMSDSHEQLNLKKQVDRVSGFLQGSIAGDFVKLG